MPAIVELTVLGKSRAGARALQRARREHSRRNRRGVRKGQPSPRPPRHRKPEITEERKVEHRRLVEEAIVNCPAYGGHQEPRGIVMVAGGKFFPSAYVTLRVLKKVGCKLPVEIWYLGRNGEKQPWMESAVESIGLPGGVTWVDGDEVAKTYPCRILNGWELKAFAVLRTTRFREVLYLDSDSYPVNDPEYLFDEPHYKNCGALFFPDKVEEDLHMWCKSHGVPDPREVLGIECIKERAVEAGQFIVDRQRCWKELHLAWHLNDHSDFWYGLFYGDKETFHLAWRKLGTEFAMPPGRWAWRTHTMVQKDFQGWDTFLHRCRGKFVLPWESGPQLGFMSGQEGWGKRDDSLPHEDFCWKAIEDLARLAPSPEEKWPGDVRDLAEDWQDDERGVGDTVHRIFREHKEAGFVEKVLASAKTARAGLAIAKIFNLNPKEAIAGAYKLFTEQDGCPTCRSRQDILNTSFSYDYRKCMAKLGKVA